MEMLPYTQEFVVEIASDWDDPKTICLNHEVSKAEYTRLLKFQPFIDAVAATRVALTEGSVTAAFKAKLAVEDLIPTIFKIAEGAADPKVQIDAFNALKGLAGLGKNNTPVDLAAGYTLQINLGEITSQVQPPVLKPVLDAISLDD
jgi:hypothetical protein